MFQPDGNNNKADNDHRKNNSNPHNEYKYSQRNNNETHEQHESIQNETKMLNNNSKDTNSISFSGLIINELPISTSTSESSSNINYFRSINSQNTNNSTGSGYKSSSIAIQSRPNQHDSLITNIPTNLAHDALNKILIKFPNKSYGQFISNQSAKHKQNNNQMTNDDFKITFIPSRIMKINNNNNNHSLPRYYNKFTSFSVNDSCNDVMNKLCVILSSYSNDINYKVNLDKYCIDGVVFMTNYNEIFFMISIFRENAQKSKIEFIRKSGESLSFAKFWCDIKDIYLKRNGDKNENKFQFVDININNMDVMDIDIDFDEENIKEENKEEEINKELDEFNLNLVEDDEYSSDFMRIFCLNKITQSKINEYRSKILAHYKLMNTLICSSMLSKNISIVRGSLIIIIEIIKYNDYNDEHQEIINLFNKYNLWKSIIYLLNHENELINKMTLKLLYLIIININNKLIIKDIKTKNQLKNAINQYKNKWHVKYKENRKYYPSKKNGIINYDMFNIINNKLS